MNVITEEFGDLIWPLLNRNTIRSFIVDKVQHTHKANEGHEVDIDLTALFMEGGTIRIKLTSRDPNFIAEARRNFASRFVTQP